VLIRDGKVDDVVHGGRAFGMGGRTAKVIDHPVFGPLRFIDLTLPWVGFTRCGPLSEFATIADARAMNRPRRGKPPPYLAIGWEFARGEFDLDVHTSGGKPPSDEQAQSLASFLKDRKRGADTVIAALFDDYRANLAARRQKYVNPYQDELLPQLNSADGLRELVQLERVSVFPEKQGAAAVGLVFKCAWFAEERFATIEQRFAESIGVRWRNGKVEALGPREVAEP
jgi:hypothetical protein